MPGLVEQLRTHSGQRYHALGSTESVIPRLNQGLTLLADGRYDEARGLLGECRRLLERIQRKARVVTAVDRCHALNRAVGVGSRKTPYIFAQLRQPRTDLHY